jgi:hypothetical protein
MHGGSAMPGRMMGPPRMRGALNGYGGPMQGGFGPRGPRGSWDPQYAGPHCKIMALNLFLLVLDVERFFSV